MNERICPRCGSHQVIDPDTPLVFCWNCGLPQVVLSEELREQAEEQARRTAAGEPDPVEGGGAVDVQAPDAVVWRGAILCALFTGGVAASITMLSLAIPQAGFFSWLWAMGAPIVAMGIYSSRFRATRITPGFGARLGLLCGLLITLGISIVNTIGLVLSRFVFHGARAFDTELAHFYAQAVAAAIARSGQAAAAPFIAMLRIPEFRAGILLASTGMVIFVYLLFSAAGGAFAGLLRQRAQMLQP